MNMRSAWGDQPGEEILREVLSRLHSTTIAGGQRELVAQQLRDHLHCRHLAVAVQWEPEFSRGLNSDFYSGGGWVGCFQEIFVILGFGKNIEE